MKRHAPAGWTRTADGFKRAGYGPGFPEDARRKSLMSVLRQVQDEMDARWPLVRIEDAEEMAAFQDARTAELRKLNDC